MDRLRQCTALLLLCGCLSIWTFYRVAKDNDAVPLPLHAEETIAKCRNLHSVPSPPRGFSDRERSDRFVPGTRPTLLKNATLWTGRDAGLEIVHGDLLLDGGIIKAIGTVDAGSYGDELDVVDVEGAWVSPGIVDLHSHMGVESSPGLTGAIDGNSLRSSVQPWLRSLDGLNTHDESYRLAIAGGLTTALVLPGSANAIGGQAFTIKTRPTAEKSPSSMLLEPPFHLNGSEYDPPRWRQMKHACGENPARVYGGTRMDTVWDFRTAYNTARILKEKQDVYCEKALAGQWTGLGEFPDDLAWEALVDVLRGRVKVHNHCYEAVDIDGMVRLTNEFKFSIAAFHHAHESYLIPEALKNAYGITPASAIFAIIGRYKRESYRHSEYAPRILADAGIDVVMKTDHPLVNARYLLHEAQQAHYYGLPAHIALSSVITTPARIMGLAHRIGSLVKGHDADVVIWDSHPLALGAAPKQVYIDGIPQLEIPHLIPKPLSSQKVPLTPNFDTEAKEAVKYDGTQPLDPKATISGAVVFENVKSVYVQRAGKVVEAYFARNGLGNGVVHVENGKMLCYGSQYVCLETKAFAGATRIDLEGGSIAPGLVSVGTDIGLSDIQFIASTTDGVGFDLLSGQVPAIVGEETVIRAVDGLKFQSRDMLLAYRSGVTSAVVSPQVSLETHGFFSGLATAFSTGAKHKLERGAVIKDVSGLHVILSMAASHSVSTMVGTLRRLLSGQAHGDIGEQFESIVEGRLPLVIYAHNADIMASMIALKAETEERTGIIMKMTFVGATESHLIAAEIADAGVGVILGNSRPFPTDWQAQRILPGPPLTRDTTLGVLLKHNVSVAIGIDPLPRGPLQSFARNARFDAAWAALEMDGEMSSADTLALASVNVASLLGLDVELFDLVATKGGTLLEFESKVVGVISSRRGVTDIL
ncbi:composite domain of metallo-dependent hydrolase [Hymenopellis radicata]|nr:composite domain of metallo-dependent hydrolase [Hymenopellis radicata]